VELRIFTEPQQGATYDDLMSVARCAEDAGYGAFFRSDHYLNMGGGDPGPGSTDAWITLAGLARETSTIRLGTLMSAGTFRLPGPLAIAVAGVDQMSGGRVEFGLGSGWYADEHSAYGIPFPSLGERFERYTEQLEIVTGLWTATGPFSFAGKHYTITDSPALPKPVQSPRPPVLIGGKGAKRTPRLAARFADEFNVPFSSPSEAKAQYDRVDAACAEAGRDPRSIVRSVALTACVGIDEATVTRRADAIGRPEAELRENGLGGTVDEAVARLGEWASLGVQRVYLQMLDLADLDHLEFIASEVAPQLS
jgi:alkanesulfonate monooxygenase